MSNNVGLLGHNVGGLQKTTQFCRLWHMKKRPKHW